MKLMVMYDHVPCRSRTLLSETTRTALHQIWFEMTTEEMGVIDAYNSV